MVRCECGLTYVSGDQKDEDEHTRLHDEYLHGPVLPPLPGVGTSATIGTFPLFVIDGSVPAPLRRKLVDVVYVASPPEFPTGYDGMVTEYQKTLFLVADGDRAVALAITALDDYYWRLSWKRDGTVELVSNHASSERRPKIARVWVAKDYRQHGIGSGLVKAIGEHLSCALPDIGWELPLTSDGAMLVQKLMPGHWWGSGDPFALQETLSSSR